MSAPLSPGGNAASSSSSSSSGQQQQQQHNNTEVADALASMQSVMRDGLLMNRRRDAEQQKLIEATALMATAANKATAQSKVASDAKALRSEVARIVFAQTVHIITLATESERLALTGAMVEAWGQIEADETDIEGANDTIETAAKKLDKTEDEKKVLAKALKMSRKLAVIIASSSSVASTSSSSSSSSAAAGSAVSSFCTRCHNVQSHTVEKCSAKMTAEGSIIMVGANQPSPMDDFAITSKSGLGRKRMGGEQGGYRGYGGYGGGRGGGASYHSGYDHQQQQYAPQQYASTPMHYQQPQQYQSSSMPYSQPYVPRLCHNCQQPGHIAASCSLPSRNGQRPVMGVAPVSSGGEGSAKGESGKRGSIPLYNDEEMKASRVPNGIVVECGEDVDVISIPDRQSDRDTISFGNDVMVDVIPALAIIRDRVEQSEEEKSRPFLRLKKGTKNQSEKETMKEESEKGSEEKSRPFLRLKKGTEKERSERDENEPSIGRMIYEAASLNTTRVSDIDITRRALLSDHMIEKERCTHVPTSNTHSSLTTSSSATNDTVPVASRSRVVTDEEAQLLAALESTGMPDVDRSLRKCIELHFEGKKKLLSDAVVAMQMCARCMKKGHTDGGCPDQTQTEEHDASAKDTWVRALMTRARVVIGDVNRGLTLEEGVRRWLIVGEEANANNPWSMSTLREDTLRRRLGYHYAMGMGAVHLGWIGFGIPLNFIPEQIPPVLAFMNHKSAMEEAAFVDKEHEASVKDGSYVEVTRDELRGICPLQVEKHPTSGKCRLCQDLRWINGHLPNVKFRLESLHEELGDVVKPNDKLFTTDIEKAYYCLALHPNAQSYLGWSWRGKYYRPTCLVFGLSTAPRIFTKIMRPMMAFMRSLNVRVLGMIDDYMWAAEEGRVIVLRDMVKVVLPSLGWRLNAKCIWDPSDEVLMLGMMINAKTFSVSAPKKKIDAAISAIERVMASVPTEYNPSINSVQRVAGMLMSMMLALPAVRVYTRALYKCIAIAQEEIEQLQSYQMPYWHVKVKLSDKAIEEMKFWLHRLLTHNRLRISCRENQVEVLLWSDASDVGWGGEAAGVTVTTAETNISQRAMLQPTEAIADSMQYGDLPREEIAHSSTRRELIGLLQLVRTPLILSQIKGKRVKVLMDSIPALRNLINGGGSKPDLTAAVLEWTQYCELHNIEPVYEWVPRAENWRADKASKLHYQQHTLKSSAIERYIRDELNKIVGTHSRQTNHWMGKVPLFLPMFHQVDARVEMIRATLEEAIIVVPEWPAGGTRDWYRRIVAHSIARIDVGKTRNVYASTDGTGHNDRLSAFWMRGRRGEERQQKEKGGNNVGEDGMQSK